MHTDSASSAGSTRSSPRRSRAACPIVSAQQMLTWLDGRNDSSFGGVTWSGNTLDFTVAPSSGSNGLQVMSKT